jgi:hypothetical protein
MKWLLVLDGERSTDSVEQPAHKMSKVEYRRTANLHFSPQEGPTLSEPGCIAAQHCCGTTLPRLIENNAAAIRREMQAKPLLPHSPMAVG